MADPTEHYDWAREDLVAAYRDGVSRLTRQWDAALVAAARLRPGDRALDVACGSGATAAAAGLLGADVVGADFSFAQLQAGRRDHPGVTLVAANAERLPFADGTFGAVLNAFGLPVIADPARCAAEAFRVLRPGGRYACSTWAAAEKCVAFAMTYEAVAACGSLDVGLPPTRSVFAFGDHAAASAMMSDAGFEDVGVEDVPLVWTVASPDEIIRAIFTGTVRAATLLDRQTPKARERIIAHMRQVIGDYRRGGRYEVPAPAVVVSARKPGSA